MAADEKKAGKLELDKTKLVEVANTKTAEKSKFVKKSAANTGSKSDQSQSDSNFTFSFNIDPS